MKTEGVSKYLPLFGLALLFAASLGTAHVGPLENSFDFVYQVHVPPMPDKAGDIKIWVPLAKSNEYQKIREMRIEAPYPHEVYEDLDHGNKILHLSLDKPPAEGFLFRVLYHVSVRGAATNYEEMRKKADASLREAIRVTQPPEIGPDLVSPSTSLLVVNDKVREIAKKITKGKQTDLNKAKAIYDYVIDNMVYDKSGVGWGRGSTVYACELGRGNCTDFHSLFISLARAAGIPARFEIGAQIPRDQSEGNVGYHCWAEFYLPELGWVPVDTSEAWKHPKLRNFYFGSHDPGKFLISMGRDIHLQPAHKGNPINIFLEPYAEVGGEALDSVGWKFFFKKRGQTTFSSDFEVPKR